MKPGTLLLAKPFLGDDNFERSVVLLCRRDPAGALHECSAICPHLGCVVHWNPLETSWDCPCHGSRFTALGELLAGPANSDLAKG